MRLVPLVTATALLLAPAIDARMIKPVASPPVPKSGVRAELLHDLDDVEKKIMQLATAVPASKYSWRPARGVRSVSEVYMHIAGGNYVAAAAIASKTPTGDANLEQIVEKERVLDELRKSFDQLRAAIVGASDADLDKPVRMYGNGVTTERAAFMTALNHLHEHLGQSIAYARINGVVPPWSGM